MSGSLGDLSVSFSADISNLSSGIQSAQGKVSGFAREAQAAGGGIGGMFSSLGGAVGGFAGLAVGGLLLVGKKAVELGGQAIKMAGDFQSSMTSLVTGAGESQANLQLVSNGILSMAGQVGSSTKDLAAGMYLIESAGQHGSAALVTLRAAAEGAKVGAASLADVANGVTTIMTDYATKHVTAAQATNTLIAAVAAGKTHMGDLANAMSTVLPAAGAMGVGLTDVSAAMATMTGEGTPAAAAATYLRQLLTALENPAHKGAAALAAIGLSSKQVSDEMKVSLPATLQMITDALKKKFPEGSAAYVAALAAIAGGSKQMQGMLELTGSHLDVFKGNVASIADAVRKGGTAITGWTEVQGDFNTKMDEAKASVEAIGIKIGTFLLPVLSHVMDVVNPIIQGFGDWITSSNGLAAAFRPVGDLASGLFHDLSAFVQHNSGYFQEFFNILRVTGGQAFSILSEAFSGLSGKAGGVGGLFTSFKPFFDALSAHMPDIEIFVHLIGDTLVGAAHTLAPAIKQVSEIIGGQFSANMRFVGQETQNLGKWFKSDLSPAIAQAMPGFTKLASVIVSDVVPGLARLWAIGQQVARTILADFLPVFEKAYPVMVRISGIIAQGLGEALKFVMPYIISAAKAIGDFATQIADRVAPVIMHFWDELSIGLNWLEANWKYIWPSLSLILKGAWDEIVGIIRIAWAVISGLFKIALDLLTGDWGRAWTDLKDMLSGVWDGIKQTISGGIEIISGYFKGLASAAVGWGQGLIQGFINGIRGMFGSIGNTMSDLTNFIGGFLPHSPAKYGELSHLNEYGPSLMRGISEGITRSKPMLETAINTAIAPVVHTAVYPTGAGGAGVSAIAYPSSRGGGSSDPALLAAINNLTLAFAEHSHAIYLNADKVGATVVQHMRVVKGVRN